VPNAAPSAATEKGKALLQAGVKKARAKPLIAVGIAGGLAAAFLFVCTGGIGILYLAFRSKPKPADPAVLAIAQNNDTKPPDAEPPPPKKKRKKYNTESKITTETLDRVKRSTVYIRVVDGRGEGGTGSGFFAYEPGIVLTNAHVVGMMEADSPPPRRIDIILNSGLKDERNLTGDVVAVDSQTDVAVIRLSTKDNLPRPLEVITARDLVETQPVFICGFPLGERLGKNITVNESKISSLRTNASGDLTQVQVNGGMSPGNSGGPVVDTDGDVVGVAVSGIRGTQINFAIPGDSVDQVLNGQIKSFQLGSPSRRGDSVVVPITINTTDPLKRIRRVAVDWWEGKPGKERPASSEPPPAEAGDSEHRTVSLNYDSGVARGELVLPLSAAGTFWVQPAYAGEGFHRWMAATSYLPDVVDAKGATLAFKHPTQPIKSRLSTRSRYRLRQEENGEEHIFTRRITSQLTEETRAANPLGQCDCQVKLSDLDMTLTVDNRGEAPDDKRDQIRGLLGNMFFTLVFDTKGNLLRRSRTASVPIQLRAEADRFATEILNTLDIATVPMPPNPAVQPGVSWRTNKAVPSDTMRRGLPIGQLDVTYTYRGTRTRSGREEAVIGFRGPLVNTRGMTGNANGSAAFDLQKGHFVRVKADVEINMSLIIGGQIIKAIGNTEVVLDRE
jgi:S1-C subfamily serine protease